MPLKTLLLFLIFGCAANSQNLAKLQSETRKICDANYTMDFDVVAALTYPKIYETISETDFIEKLDTDYQNAEFRKRLQIESPVFLFSEMKKIGDTSFYIISYRNPVRYFFEQKLNDDSASKKVAELKESTKATEVIFEPKRNSINVKRNSKLIAVSDENTNGEWLFINFDDASQRDFFGSFFGDDVKKALGL